MHTDAELKAWLQTNLEHQLALLQELVEINSHSYNIDGVNSVQNVLQREFELLGLLTQRVSFPGAGDVLLATNPQPSKQPILLVGHADTVHPKDGAFQRCIRDGDRLCGPGVLDMKGGIVVMLFALKALSSLGLLSNIPLKVIINSDEEIGSQHTSTYLQEISRGAKAALVFEIGRERNDVVTRRKGVAIFELEVQGKSAHSGNFHQQGANAIWELAILIDRIQRLTNYDLGITTNVGLINGGTAVNTVPDRASAKFDLRYLNADQYKELSEKLKSIVSGSRVTSGTNCILREISVFPALEETAASLRLFESYQLTGLKAGLNYSRYPAVVGGGSDGSLISAVGVPTIDGLGPSGEFPHTEKEYILTSSLLPKTLNLALWLSFGETNA